LQRHLVASYFALSRTAIRQGVLMRGSPNDQTSGRKTSDQVPLWRAAGSVRLLVIGSMCVLPIAAIFMILQASLPWPQWLDAILIDLAGSMLLAAIASFLLTPVTLVAVIWSIF